MYRLASIQYMYSSILKAETLRNALETLFKLLAIAFICLFSNLIEFQGKCFGYKAIVTPHLDRIINTFRIRFIIMRFIYNNGEKILIITKAKEILAWVSFHLTRLPYKLGSIDENRLKMVTWLNFHRESKVQSSS